MNYDAILVVSFGGPESREDVIPFLKNVLRGRNIPRERMLAVAEHYYHFEGKSPINRQIRELVAALEKELQPDIPLPIYQGNRNWHPLLEDTLRKMQQDGIERALAFVTFGLWLVFGMPAVSGRLGARTGRSWSRRTRSG